MGRRKNVAESIAFRRKLLGRVFSVILAIICLDSFRATFFSSHLVQSVSMMPILAKGDRILATPLPFGPRTIFGKLPALVGPHRGDIVLAIPPGIIGEPFLTRFADNLARILTFQKVSIISSETGEGSLIMKRVIALPGDTIRMEKGRYRIKSPGSTVFRSESEFAGFSYTVEAENIMPNWLPGLPGSGSMEPRTLGPDEYFLAGDARNKSSDSRLWGPAKSKSLVALVLFRYWPFSHPGIQ